MRRIATLSLALLAMATLAMPAHGADYPAKDSGYHSYKEMVRHIRSVAAKYPNIVRVFSIGLSHEGRKLWAAEVSDKVGKDEGEPEVLFDGLHHAREHLSAEMPIYILDLLTKQYGKSSDLGRRVTRLVDTRRTWLVFMVNPDGLQYDLTGAPYRHWRKNRQPTSGSGNVGTDLNRNYGYRFGCCGGSSGDPAAWDYRGPRAWSAPETRALRGFIEGRRIGGQQRIRAHITFHTAGELVLWPYAYTRTGLPSDMTDLDLRTFRALGKAMAKRSGYTPMQSSALYRSDGDMIDWTYSQQRIFSFTVELYPTGGNTPQNHYPPDDIISRETKRNREMVLYLIKKASCPYAVLGATEARVNCGPFFDDLEVWRGWRADPQGTDSASDGTWQRGDPQGDVLQLGSAVSGRSALVTGRKAGHDVDGGRTSVRSPLFTLPTGRKATLKLRYWVGLSKGAGDDDGFAIYLVGKDGKRLSRLLEVSGTGRKRTPAWKRLQRTLPKSLRGKRVAIELAAYDKGKGAIVEAGVDQVRVYLD